jgi:hypothetical protein
VREARGRRLGETILAALQPIAFAPVAAIHDVVDRAGILDSQLAGQDARVARAASVANIKNRPLHPEINCQYLELTLFPLTARPDKLISWAGTRG